MVQKSDGHPKDELILASLHSHSGVAVKLVASFRHDSRVSIPFAFDCAPLPSMSRDLLCILGFQSLAAVTSSCSVNSLNCSTMVLIRLAAYHILIMRLKC